MLRPAVRGAAPRLCLRLDPEARPVAPVRVQMSVEHLEPFLRRVVGSHERNPAVTDARGALDDRVYASPEPDRDLAGGQRVEPGLRNAVPLPLEADRVPAPELAHERDLLFLALAPVVEVLAERLVLDRVPSGPDPQAQPAAREYIDLGCLLGHERRLTLRQDQHCGDQLDRVRHACEVAKGHEGLVKRGVLVVGAVPPAGSVPVRAEHVVVDQQVAIPEPLGRLGEVPDRRRVVSYFRLREYHAEFHVVLHTFVETGRADVPVAHQAYTLGRVISEVPLQLNGDLAV